MSDTVGTAPTNRQRTHRDRHGGALRRSVRGLWFAPNAFFELTAMELRPDADAMVDWVLMRDSRLTATL